MKRYENSEDDFLRENYLTVPTKRMSKMLNRSESSARQRIKILGLVIPKEVTEKFKAETFFKKGSQPVNKGKSIHDYCTPEAIEAMKTGQFKKGQKTFNYRPVGSERLTKDGYLEIKVADPNKWKGKHVVEWEKVNGKVPKGHIVVFKTGNKLNVLVENLEMITRVENMKRNTVHNYPKEIYSAIQLRGALNRQIKKHIKRLSA